MYSREQARKQAEARYEDAYNNCARFAENFVEQITQLQTDADELAFRYNKGLPIHGTDLEEDINRHLDETFELQCRFYQLLHRLALAASALEDDQSVQERYNEYEKYTNELQDICIELVNYLRDSLQQINISGYQTQTDEEALLFVHWENYRRNGESLNYYLEKIDANYLEDNENLPMEELLEVEHSLNERRKVLDEIISHVKKLTERFDDGQPNAIRDEEISQLYAKHEKMKEAIDERIESIQELKTQQLNNISLNLPLPPWFEIREKNLFRSTERVSSATARVVFSCLGIDESEYDKLDKDKRRQIKESIYEVYSSTNKAENSQKQFSELMLDKLQGQIDQTKLGQKHRSLSPASFYDDTNDNNEDFNNISLPDDNNSLSVDDFEDPKTHSTGGNATVSSLSTGQHITITDAPYNNSSNQDNPMWSASNERRQFAEYILKTLREIQKIDNDFAMRSGQLESLQEYIIANDGQNYQQTAHFLETDIQNYAEQVIKNSAMLDNAFINSPTAGGSKNNMTSVEEKHNAKQPDKKEILDELQKRQQSLEISAEIFGLTTKAQQLYDFSALEQAEERMAKFYGYTPLSHDVDAPTFDQRAQHIKGKIEENMTRVVEILNDHGKDVASNHDDVIYPRLEQLKNPVNSLIQDLEDNDVIESMNETKGRSEDVLTSNNSSDQPVTSYNNSASSSFYRKGSGHDIGSNGNTQSPLPRPVPKIGNSSNK